MPPPSALGRDPPWWVALPTRWAWGTGMECPSLPPPINLGRDQPQPAAPPQLAWGWVTGMGGRRQIQNWCGSHLKEHLSSLTFEDHIPKSTSQRAPLSKSPSWNRIRINSKWLACVWTSPCKKNKKTGRPMDRHVSLAIRVMPLPGKSRV